VKCPYCYTEFSTQAGLEAHRQSCFYKHTPLPEPEPDLPAPDCLDDLTKSELVQLAEQFGVEVTTRMTKAEIIEALQGDGEVDGPDSD